MDAIVWTLDEALAAVHSPDLELQVGCAVDVPVVVVDGLNEVAGKPATLMAKRLAALPVVSVATGTRDPAGDGFDVVSDDPEPILSAVLSHPIAAVTAAQILRVVERYSVSDALLVESLAYAVLQAGEEHQAWLAAQPRRVRRDLSAPRVLLVDRVDHIEVVLDRPRLHNLCDTAMRDQLSEAFRTIAATKRTIRWRANGPSFCAGGDPAEFGRVPDPAQAHLIRSSANVAPLLASVADRVTVTIDGPAVGAGIELAAFCGTVQAGPRARFRLPELAMGLIPGAGGTVSITNRIGRQRTLKWFLLDLELDATTACEWGLVDHLT